MTRSEDFCELLEKRDSARELGPQFYSALPEEARSAAYDSKAALYDAIVGRSLYNRIFWGTSVQQYARFGRLALEAAEDDCFGEVGCGSLLFTTAMYREARRAPAILMDRSLQMLRRASERLSRGDGGIPEQVTLLQTDAAKTPLRSGVLRSVLTLNLLHVPCDAPAIVKECARILIPGSGRLFVSALVRSGRWSDWYMSALQKAGELAAPITAEELRERVTGRWAKVESMQVEGNMCYLVVRHAG